MHYKSLGELPLTVPDAFRLDHPRPFTVVLSTNITELNNPPKEDDMQKKQDKKKKAKKQTNVRDLKPSKDAKGGKKYPDPIYRGGTS